ncbi:hypothetical protein HID58_086846 [Brassica napus]|uniref:Uncharacterized protein n=1 Tax=Brassica napus TaxID=3708 RepID=A0ABQ7XUL7_BRANA|nr:hypothetical protein HID58_086846 [Brassica napus]
MEFDQISSFRRCRETVSTHSTFTLNSLFLYLRALAIFYVVMFYVCGVLINSLSYYGPNV